MELETRVTAEQVKLRLEAWFDTRGAVVAHFGDEWAQSLDHGETDFTPRAERIIQLYPGFQALNFVDADWIIRTVVPEEPNLPALNKNLHVHPSAGVREAVQMALTTRAVQRTPLIQLLQGGAGFATYYPVVLEDGTIAGFINGVFGVDELVNSCLNEASLRERFNFRLISNDGQEAFLHSADDFGEGKGHLIRLPVRIVKGDWTFEITLSSQGLNRAASRADELMAAVGYSLSILLALLFWAYQRRRAELEEGRERYRLIVENQADLLIKILPDGIIRYTSPSLQRFVGQSESQLEGASFRSLVAEEDLELFDQGMKELQDPPHLRDEEFRLKTPGGDVWTAWKGNAYFDAEGRVKGFIGVGRDIAQRRDLEGQLRRSQRLQAVGQLAGGIAHDFNNILQAIQGYVEYVMDELPKDSESYSDLDQARMATERAAVLVKQLLAFSRRQVLQPENLSLNGVVEGMQSMLERVLGASIQIELDLDEGPTLVRADKGQLEQILMNLAVNARDAMPSGGDISISTRSLMLDVDFCRNYHERKAGPYISLKMIDSGEGMSPAVLDKIFEPFFSTKDAGQGTGLGLAMVYGIIQQHDGIITVESQEGHGSCFTIYLPCVEGENHLDENGTPHDFASGTETILFAEDDPLLRRLGRRIMSSVGYNVLTCHDGREGLKLFQDNAQLVDILVLDVVMPNLNGVDLALKVRESRPEMPVVFVSGYDSDLANGRRDPLPGSIRITKPYNSQDLLSAIRQILDNPEKPNGNNFSKG